MALCPGLPRWASIRKVKTNLDFSEARDSEWQWHQLGHMQVCTSLQTDNHTSTPPLSFYRPDALPAAQPTVSKHGRQNKNKKLNCLWNWCMCNSYFFILLKDSDLKKCRRQKRQEVKFWHFLLCLLVRCFWVTWISSTSVMQPSEKLFNAMDNWIYLQYCLRCQRVKPFFYFLQIAL